MTTFLTIAAIAYVIFVSAIILAACASSAMKRKDGRPE